MASQRVQVQDFEVVALVPDEAASRPVAQVLVDAFPRRADEVAQFLLRQLEFDAHPGAAFGAVIPCQPEQLLRQPGANVQKGAILDADREFPDTACEHGQELDRDWRGGCEQTVKCAFVHDRHLAFLQRGYGGGARLAVENADFAEDLSGTHDVDGSVGSVGALRSDFRAAAQQHEKLGGRVTLGDDRLPRLVHPGFGQLRQADEDRPLRVR